MRYARYFIVPGLVFLLVLLVQPSCREKPPVTESAGVKKQTYTCPMHPQVVSDKPGSCPICGMDLVPFDKTNTSEVLTLNESQQALANVSTDTIRTGSFSSVKRLNGRLAVNPGQSEFVSSRVAGRIEALYVRETGVPVRRGQALYKIYSEQLASLQQEYIVTVAQAVQFPNDIKFQQLAVAAKQKLALYGQSEQQIRELRNRKQTSPYITYFSPADGTVSELMVTEGQYVSEGSSIMSLEGYHNIWVEADLYPAEANLVKKGQLVNVIISGFENEPVKMQIDFIAPALQSGNQLLTVRGSITNPRNQFKAGMQAIVEIPVMQTSGALTLPVEAVIREQGGAHVWVQSGKGQFKPQMVETGAENFDRVEVTSGLNEGDVVVITGAYLLYSEYKLKKGKDPMEGHQH